MPRLFIENDNSPSSCPFVIRAGTRGFSEYLSSFVSDCATTTLRRQVVDVLQLLLSERQTATCVTPVVQHGQTDVAM